MVILVSKVGIPLVVYLDHLVMADLKQIFRRNEEGSLATRSYIFARNQELNLLGGVEESRGSRGVLILDLLDLLDIHIFCQISRKLNIGIHTSLLNSHLQDLIVSDAWLGEFSRAQCLLQVLRQRTIRKIQLSG